jgi:hypothetical protein
MVNTLYRWDNAFHFYFEIKIIKKGSANDLKKSLYGV